MSSIYAKGCMLMIVCVLSGLTCLPLLGEIESHGILLLLLLYQRNIYLIIASHFSSLCELIAIQVQMSIQLLSLLYIYFMYHYSLMQILGACDS